MNSILIHFGSISPFVLVLDSEILLLAYLENVLRLTEVTVSK